MVKMMQDLVGYEKTAYKISKKMTRTEFLTHLKARFPYVGISVLNNYARRIQCN